MSNSGVACRTHNNVICGLFNLHKWNVLRETWVNVKETPDIQAFLRYEECVVCGKTKATMTHPFKDITCQASPVFNDFRYASEAKG